jgi:hypothetical protein
MDPITDAELDAIAARADAATSGPWESFVEGRDACGGDSFIRIGGLDDAAPDLYLTHYFWVERPTPVPAPVADLDFVAHARQDIPRLIAEIRRLRTIG